MWPSSATRTTGPSSAVIGRQQSTSADYATFPGDGRPVTNRRIFAAATTPGDSVTAPQIVQFWLGKGILRGCRACLRRPVRGRHRRPARWSRSPCCLAGRSRSGEQRQVGDAQRPGYPTLPTHLNPCSVRQRRPEPPSPGAGGGEQQEAVTMHPLDLATSPELLDHPAIDLLDVHLPPAAAGTLMIIPATRGKECPGPDSARSARRVSGRCIRREWAAMAPPVAGEARLGLGV